MNYLGKKIKEMRLKKGWTLRDLAAVSGVSHGNIGKIEQGKLKTPSLRTFIHLVFALKGSFPKLLELAGKDYGR